MQTLYKQEVFSDPSVDLTPDQNIIRAFPPFTQTLTYIHVVSTVYCYF